jgi:predicted Zn-dependent peptidase
MALILSGNFDIEEAKTLIEKNFSSLGSGELEKEEIAAPKPFIGREFHKVRMTPVTAGIIGFRTAPRFHEDYAALMVCGNLLQNQSQTGLIDELTKNNQLMMAFAYSDFYDEAGEMTFIFIPKILRQSAKNAEKLILEKIQKLKNGEFSDDLFQLVKNEIYLDHQRSLEASSSRIRILNDYFRKGLDWSYSDKFIEDIQSLSKEEVIAIANKYLGKDYIAMYSKTGFGKKEKLDKPPLIAVEANQDQKSEYGLHFEALESKEASAKFVDFEKDLDIVDLKEGSRLYHVNNPMNSIFRMTFKYHLGAIANPNLIPLAEQLNYVNLDSTSLKKAIALNGANYSFKVDNDYFVLTMEGMEEGLADNIKLIGQLMRDAKLNDSQLQIAKNSLITELRRESEESFVYVEAMANYNFYGDESYYLKRQGEKELKSLALKSTTEAFEDLKKASISIHYSGKTDSKEVAELLKSYYPIPDNGISLAPYKRERNDLKEDEIILLNNKKLLQSHLFMAQKGSSFKAKDEAMIRLFNEYFGGGFSGILKQEIREYRSLAYSTNAAYKTSNNPTTSNYFYAYVGCQADKTNEAVKVTYDLIQNIPAKEERMEGLKKKVIQASLNEYPNFRELSEQVEWWNNHFYLNDPNQYLINEYDKISMEDLKAFYDAHISEPNTSINIYGDLKRIDLDELRKIAKTKEIKAEDVINF